MAMSAATTTPSKKWRFFRFTFGKTSKFPTIEPVEDDEASNYRIRSQENVSQSV